VNHFNTFLISLPLVAGLAGLPIGAYIYSLGTTTCGAGGNFQSVKTDLYSLQSALEQYKNIGGQYPSQEQGLQALFQRPVSQPLPRDWVQAVDDADAFLDPWGTLYHYQYSGTGIFEKPKLISAGPDKKFGTKDDLSNQHEVR